MRIVDVFSSANVDDYEVFNETCELFNAVLPTAVAGKGDITWIRPGMKNAEELIDKCKAACLICNKETFELATKAGKESMFIVTSRPEVVFLRVLQYVSAYKTISERTAQIHATAIIDKNCVLGSNVSVGAYSIIGKAVIGDNCVISNHVQIHDDVIIGKNCLIREFCSIGGQGFNFVKNELGFLEHMPHIGKVVIEEDVQIFPFSNVDRGTLTETRVSKGVKIDHYCHIGHNSRIGENTMVAAQAVTCGGVTVGKDCFIGVNSLIRNNLIIGDKVTIGLGAVVTKHVPDNETWIGNPAKPLTK
jgi:UDP-3-O-[3-hydroxymyristoyl] glucosamine N-acyltransferase